MFIDVTASRFSKSGQRVFSANGNVFPLGIPLTAKLTPLEVTAGWRFARRSRLIPYVGAGIGTYKYSEESPFSDPGEEPDTRHTGLLVLGGAEARVHRWVAVAADLQYTHIGGVLGDAGVSKIFGESDLGGLAARFRVIVGR
jgi:opacity protein-like surface antigen